MNESQFITDITHTEKCSTSNKTIDHVMLPESCPIPIELSIKKPGCSSLPSISSSDSLSTIHLEVVLPTKNASLSMLEHEYQVEYLGSNHLMITRSKTNSLPPPRVFTNDVVVHDMIELKILAKALN